MTIPDRYAVFGDPINHSKSPRIHQLFAKQTQQLLSYHAQQVSAEQFTHCVNRFFEEGGKGINCTVPLKELAWHYAQQKTARAQLAKAVNTLALQADGSILGDNTDGCGLITDLTSNYSITLVGQKILVLGAGGASRGIIAPLLEQMPEQLVIANRTIEKAINLASEFASIAAIQGCGFDQLSGKTFDLIINATSASLNNQLPLLSKNLMTKETICYDLSYSNQATAFVRWGQENNARKSLDGLGMLVEQAADAFYLWRGIRPETTGIINQLNLERHQPFSLD